MQFEIQAGAKVDILTPAEAQQMYHEAQAWRVELARNVKFRPISAKGIVSGGVYTIGGDGSPGLPGEQSPPQLSPNQGFLWALLSVAISGGGIVLGTDTFSLYRGEATPSRLIGTGFVRQALFSGPQAVIFPGSRLLATGPGTGVASTEAILSGLIAEVPIQYAWKLLF